MWEVHSTELSNLESTSKTKEHYAHCNLSDLHWAVILDFTVSNDKMKILYHTWGEIRENEVSFDIFRKMTNHLFLLTIK